MISTKEYHIVKNGDGSAMIREYFVSGESFDCQLNWNSGHSTRYIILGSLEMNGGGNPNLIRDCKVKSILKSHRSVVSEQKKK